LIKEALGAKARVYGGKEPLRGETRSSVILCSKCEDVAQGMRRLRAQAPDVPVLVFGSTLEPRLAEEALRAGASGFIHAEMWPARITLALSIASEGEVIISRELLGELVGQRLFTRWPKLLEP
jgi:DNA-binding NarL/FixJ family response regulator